MDIKNIKFVIRKDLGKIPMFFSTYIFGPVAWKLGFVFLTWYHGNPNRIGELAIQCDMYTKMSKLGIAPKAKGILLLREKPANFCLMEYWKKYIHVISNPVLVCLLYPIASFIQYNTPFVKMPNGEIISEAHAVVTVQKMWEDNDYLPLLELNHEHYKKGKECLKSEGIPEDGWFVCIHAREHGFLNQAVDDSDSAFRNVDIDTYSKAIETITNNGGWVIRMGDPTTKPLPDMYHVIDYAHSKIRSDWMDIFLCAECRFFLGCDSGLYLVAYNFGVLSVQVNYFPMGIRPPGANTIYIPKLYKLKGESCFMPLREALKPPYDMSYVSHDYKQVEVVDNTSEDINNAVKEMFDYIDLGISPIRTYEDECNQTNFVKMYSYNNTLGYSIISSAFIKKYKEDLKKRKDKSMGD